jgi:hypothetical protein
MHFTPPEIAALIVAASFAAGLNTYATVATLGILGRTGWIALPGSLHVVTQPWVIVVALALFVAEFFADKLPAFDVVWNAAHTFVRIPVAALLAFAAASHLSPTDKLLAMTAGGLIAAIAHTSKTAARVLVTPSPEPLSTAEDAGAVGLTWLATHHPYTAATIAGIAILVLILCMRLLLRGARRIFGSVKYRLQSWTGTPSRSGSSKA